MMSDMTVDSLPGTVFPACYVEMPSEGRNRRAAFYLAAEEYIAVHFPPGNYLFTWQTEPTVVMGRNQVAHMELDLDFCRAEGIDVIRRKSGGGSIYADKGNIMTSLITGKGAVEQLFSDYATHIAACLTRLGARAEVSGRNDILLEGGGKICGNAFYHMKNNNIVHGTMLYNTDYRLMTGALTPDRAKMAAKGVTSVKSRTALLKDILDISVEELQAALRIRLTDRSIGLTEKDVEAIGNIEEGYYDSTYLFGNSIPSDAVIEGKIEGCGFLSLHFKLKGSCIGQVEINGDYFALGNVEEEFNKTFHGREFTRESLAEAIETCHPERTIRGLEEKALKGLIDR